MTVLASGMAADGTIWELDVSGDEQELQTMVVQRRRDGRRPWSFGAGGPAVHRGRRITVSMGSADDALRTFIARVGVDVRAVLVTLSNGVREHLTVVGDVERWGARVAVLVYPRDLDIHRVDLIGTEGRTLAEET